MNDLLENKIAQFQWALDLLENAVLPNANDLEIDGSIHRFERCYELAWKTLKLRLERDGITEISSPKAAIQKGFIAGFIDNESEWLSILKDRNLTVHTYDEKTAREIFQRLPGHLSAFMLLLDKIKRDLE